MSIDVNFDYWRELNPDRNIWEAKGSADPDSKSRHLQQAHQLLWSKPLPSGEIFALKRAQGTQLRWEQFRLSSDSITNSYMADSRVKAIVSRERDLAEELFRSGCKIGAFILFPANRINRKNTINGARGMSAKVADRIDLTLECIRRHYFRLESPLSDVLSRYAPFFSLFETFDKYVEFWFLNDLVNAQNQVRFFLPFDNFERNALPVDANEYAQIANHTLRFLASRQKRIESYLKKSRFSLADGE